MIPSEFGRKQDLQTVASQRNTLTEQELVDRCAGHLQKVLRAECAIVSVVGNEPPFTAGVGCRKRRPAVRESVLREFIASRWQEGGLSLESIAALPALSGAAFVQYETPSPFGVRVRMLVFGVGPSVKTAHLLPAEEEDLRLRIENLRLSHAMARRSAILAELHQRVSGLNRQLLNVADLLQTVTEEARRLLGTDSAALLLSEVTGEGVVLRVKAFAGKSPENTPHHESLYKQALQDYESSRRRILLEVDENGERLLIIPLAQRDQPPGLLFFSTNKESYYYTEDLLQMAELFSDWVSIAIENAVMFERVSASQREWESTFDSISDPIYLIDSDYRLKKINKSLASYAMLSIKLPLEKSCFKYLFHRNTICPWCPVPRSLQTGQAVMSEAPVFSDGIWQIHTFPYTDKSEKRTGSINVMRDITPLKRMQEQLIESEKMASTGKLISGVAHEVRNPLFGISTTVRALANELGNKAELKPFLDIVTSETTRLNRLMEELLNYSRPVKIDKNPSDVSEILQEVIGRYRNMPGVGVALRLFGAENVPPISVDRNKIQQVLLNLVENAIQHSADQAQIDVFLEFLSLSYPPEIHIVIKDHGSGISADVLPRIFDPFFTTRTRGTGLGLSIVRKVVHDHGGRISVESHVGIGTTFRISLPVHMEQR